MLFVMFLINSFSEEMPKFLGHTADLQLVVFFACIIDVTGLNFEITFVNNTSSSTTCFKYCISLDFRPSIMEFPTRHLALCNRIYLSGCSQFKQVGTR